MYRERIFSAKEPIKIQRLEVKQIWYSVLHLLADYLKSLNFFICKMGQYQHLSIGLLTRFKEGKKEQKMLKNKTRHSPHPLGAHSTDNEEMWATQFRKNIYEIYDQ